MIDVGDTVMVYAPREPDDLLSCQWVETQAAPDMVDEIHNVGHERLGAFWIGEAVRGEAQARKG